MPNIDQIEVYRIYQCTNTNCECITGYNQKATARFRKRCPICHKNTLLLKSAKTNETLIFSLNKPKTMGSLGEKNYQDAVARGEITPKEKSRKPWWRPKNKLNFDILKNPNKYIYKGKY